VRPDTESDSDRTASDTTTLLSDQVRNSSAAVHERAQLSEGAGL
jgi:hypothetical protein